MENQQAVSEPRINQEVVVEPQINVVLQMIERMMQSQERATALQRIDHAIDKLVEKIGLFEGKNITKFLQVYVTEMGSKGLNQHDVQMNFVRMVELPLRNRVSELATSSNDWVAFEQALLNEYMLGDTIRASRRSFLDWVDKEDKKISVMELLKEFEARYNQLTTTERTLLEQEKVILFLKASDRSYREKLVAFLEDWTTPTGLVSDWNRVHEACNRISKRAQWCEDLSIAGGMKDEVKTTIREDTGSPSTISKVPETVMDDLIKGIKDLSLHVAKLQEEKSSQPQKDYERRCIWCDSVDHSRGGCDNYQEAIERGVIFFKDGKIHSSETRLPLRTNFRRGGMRRIIEDAEITRTQVVYQPTTTVIHVGEGGSESEFWPCILKAARKGKIEFEKLKSGGDVVRSKTGWEDLVDGLSAFAKVATTQAHEVIIEEKRKWAENEDNKKRELRSAKKRETESPKMVSPDIEKGKDKKSPSFKLLSDIEASTDLKKVLEERILDSKVELSLRELLGIAKKEFHDAIIDGIKRKRQSIEAAENPGSEVKKATVEVLKGEPSSSIVGTQAIATTTFEEKPKELKSYYAKKHWARATTETPVKIENLEDPVVALIDHGSEINLISYDIYRKGGWPMETNHGWRVKSANSTTEQLHGACPNIKVTIGDVPMEQHFFIQKTSSYPVILGQPYITSSRMETKVLEDGSAYARIRSTDGKRSVQFLTVRQEHDRNKEELRINSCEHDMSSYESDF